MREKQKTGGSLVRNRKATAELHALHYKDQRDEALALLRAYVWPSRSDPTSFDVREKAKQFLSRVAGGGEEKEDPTDA